MVATTVLTQPLSITGCDQIEIKGLTFSNTSETYGLYCSDATPLISHCQFAGNLGVCPFFCTNSEPNFSSCLFTGNLGFLGGGYFSGSTGSMDHCLIVDNQQNSYARSLLLINSQIFLTNCTIAHNVSDTVHAELSSNYGLIAAPSILLMQSHLDLGNSILWEGEDAIVDIEGESTVSIHYSNLSEVVEETWLGEGNLWTDPLFATEGDYHLQSQTGRWDTDLAQWVTDSATSPCIDAGDPESPLGQESGSRINMGAYGGTAEASL